MFFLISFPVQSHQRQHNKDKPYKCPNCYRAYTDSASLQIHLSAHAIKNAKSYCCSMCGRAYTSVSTDHRSTYGKIPLSSYYKTVFCFSGNLPYEAHVQTHRGGASRQPPFPTENRISQHPHTHFTYLSFPPHVSLPWKGILFAAMVFRWEKRRMWSETSEDIWVWYCLNPF